MDILEKIVANKRIEVAHQKEAVPLDMLFRLGAQRLSRQPVSMRQALEQSVSGIIAEFKRRSPSKGWLSPHAKVEEVIPVYDHDGAAACSILTDSRFFGGSFSDLQRARSLVQLPLLRKDFIIDAYQIYQSLVLGADAILLIAACLTEDACNNLARTAHQLGLEVLLEVHAKEELTHHNEHIDMLGVNNRKLGTFHTDINNSFRMIQFIKSEVGTGIDAPLLISESGISEMKEMEDLRAVGFRGFLIGETLMKDGFHFSNYKLQRHPESDSEKNYES